MTTIIEAVSGDEIEDGWFAASQIQTKGSRETSRSIELPEELVGGAGIL